MSEGEDSFSHENETRLKRYSLDRVTVEALTKVREMPGKMKEFPWPLELQGKGTTNEEEKTMLVRFPKGDIFFIIRNRNP